MKTIYKYELEITYRQDLMLPIEYDVIDVDAQNGKLCLWAIVDPEEKETSSLTVMIKGTGHDITDEEYHQFFHVKSVVMPNFLVWHVFICAEEFNA